MIDERKIARDQIEKATIQMIFLEGAMYDILESPCASPTVRAIVREALAKCERATNHRHNR